MLHPTLRPLRPALSFAREWLLLVYVTVRDFSRVASYISRRTLRVVANERDDRVVRLVAIVAVVAIVVKYFDLVALVVIQAGSVSNNVSPR